MPTRVPAAGFTYLGLIILVAVIGLVGAASLKAGSLMQRAAAEEELLDIGAAFSDALRSYAAATPRGQPQQPQTLQDLLKDPRFPNPRRHLRKIFVDPVTGKAEWGVMYLGDKVGVLGVYSLSQSRPLKVANFDPRFLNMENREHLSDWKFTLSSQTMMPGAFQPAAPAPAGAADGAQTSLFDSPAPVKGAPGDTPPPLTQEDVQAAQARAAAVTAEAERVAQERAEAETLAAERIEAQRLETERIEAEKAEVERAELDKAAAEKAEADKAEAEKNPRPTEPRPSDPRTPAPTR